jgi:hypothetical protein
MATETFFCGASIPSMRTTQLLWPNGRDGEVRYLGRQEHPMPIRGRPSSGHRVESPPHTGADGKGGGDRSPPFLVVFVGSSSEGATMGSGVKFELALLERWSTLSLPGSKVYP